MTQEEIKAAIKEASKGILKYIEIMGVLGKVNVSECLIFQKLYKGFYRVRRNDEWCKVYFSHLENNKVNNDISFDNVLDYISEKTGRCEASFSSKLVATINPNKPIWDRWIIQNTGHRAPLSADKNKIALTKAAYRSIENWYDGFLKSDDGKLYVQTFNKILPKDIVDRITDLKKVDFILWQIRTKKK